MSEGKARQPGTTNTSFPADDDPSFPAWSSRAYIQTVLLSPGLHWYLLDLLERETGFTQTLPSKIFNLFI